MLAVGCSTKATIKQKHLKHYFYGYDLSMAIIDFKLKNYRKEVIVCHINVLVYCSLIPSPVCVRVCVCVCACVCVCVCVCA